MNLLEAPYMQVATYLQSEGDRWVGSNVAQLHVLRRFCRLLTGKKQGINSYVSGDGPEESSKAEEPSSKERVLERLTLVAANHEKCVSSDRRSRSPARGSDGKFEGKDWRLDGSNGYRRSQSRDGRRLDPAFKGCWRCGETGHSRTKGETRTDTLTARSSANIVRITGACPPTLTKVNMRNVHEKNGKLPQTKSVPVAMLIAHDEPNSAEHPETCEFGNMLKFAFSGPNLLWGVVGDGEEPLVSQPEW